MPEGPRQSSTGLHRPLWIGVAIFVAMLVVALVGRGMYSLSAMGQHDAYDLEMFNVQVRKLKAGEAHAIYLYDSNGTDTLLKEIRGMPEVEELKLDLTDATDAGMGHVATLLNLRELILYGGPHPVGDAGLLHLRSCATLEKLSLINTEVTDRGLPALQELPNLRSLTLYRDAFRERTISDAGLIHLKSLANLRSLALTGGWVTDGGVHYLNGIASLQSLRLEGSQVTDAGLQELKHLKTLESLDVRGTAVTDAGVAELNRVLPDLIIAQ